MITGQDHDENFKLETSKDVVKISAYSDECISVFRTTLSGEAAIKIGHSLIAAGEEALKKAGRM